MHVLPELNGHSKPQVFLRKAGAQSSWAFAESMDSDFRGHSLSKSQAKTIICRFCTFFKKAVCFNQALYRLTHMKNKITLIYTLVHTPY